MPCVRNALSASVWCCRSSRQRRREQVLEQRAAVRARPAPSASNISSYAPVEPWTRRTRSPDGDRPATRAASRAAGRDVTASSRTQTRRCRLCRRTERCDARNTRFVRAGSAVDAHDRPLRAVHRQEPRVDERVQHVAAVVGADVPQPNGLSAASIQGAASRLKSLRTRSTTVAKFIGAPPDGRAPVQRTSHRHARPRRAISGAIAAMRDWSRTSRAGANHPVLCRAMIGQRRERRDAPSRARRNSQREAFDLVGGSFLALRRAS